MNPTFSARKRASSLARRLDSSQPSTLTWPRVGESRQPRTLSRVLLPEPDGPITAIHSPLSALKVMPRNASTESPYFFVRSCTSTNANPLFSLQNNRRLNRPHDANRKHRSPQRQERGEATDQGKSPPNHVESNSEKVACQAVGPEAPDEEPGAAPHHAENGGLGQKQSHHLAIARPEGLHHADVLAPFQHDGRHRCHDAN